MLAWPQTVPDIRTARTERTERRTNVGEKTRRLHHHQQVKFSAHNGNDYVGHTGEICFHYGVDE